MMMQEEVLADVPSSLSETHGFAMLINADSSRSCFLLLPLSLWGSNIVADKTMIGQNMQK